MPLRSWSPIPRPGITGCPLPSQIHCMGFSAVQNYGVCTSVSLQVPNHSQLLNWQVMSNCQIIESSIPRVGGLTESPCAPVPRARPMGEVSRSNFPRNRKALLWAWELGKVIGFEDVKDAAKPGGPIGGIRDAMVDLRFVLAVSLSFEREHASRPVRSRNLISPIPFPMWSPPLIDRTLENHQAYLRRGFSCRSTQDPHPTTVGSTPNS